MDTLTSSSPLHDPAAKRARVARAATLAAIIGTVLVAAVLWWLGARAEQRAIWELPSAERQALYQRTLHTLQQTCARTTDTTGLDDYCREQAEFIVQFPECDQACRTLANRHRGPTK